MRLSVIIPTHDRPGTLRKTLTALAGQTLARDEFEVLVVDDGSSERHRDELRSGTPPLAYTLLEKPQGGLASARNHGADRARGSVLLFLDDDVVPAPDTLREHVVTHEGATEPVAVVGALPYPPYVEPDAFLWYLERSGHYDLYKNPRKYPGGAPPLPPLNGNSSVAREVFSAAGRYDESFRHYGGEDLELGYRLARRGVRFVYNPRAIGYHDHVKDFARFCSDMEAAGESLIALYRKYPEIKGPKKIDVLEDRLRDLPAKKKAFKVILALSLSQPWLMLLARRVLARLAPAYALRHLTFPFYRWVGHYHYAVGMRRALAASR